MSSRRRESISSTLRVGDRSDFFAQINQRFRNLLARPTPANLVHRPADVLHDAEPAYREFVGNTANAVHGRRYTALIVPLLSAYQKLLRQSACPRCRYFSASTSPRPPPPPEELPNPRPRQSSPSYVFSSGSFAGQQGATPLVRTKQQYYITISNISFFYGYKHTTKFYFVFVFSLKYLIHPGI